MELFKYLKKYIGYLLTSPYALILWLRHKLYDWNVCKSYSFDTPTICVGNVTVGGTGKTPMVQFLLKEFLKEGEVAVLSRGYKRRGKCFKYVTAKDSPEVSGDEPLQIKRLFPNAIVAVDTQRAQAMKRLRIDHPQLKLVILDDAFQHRSLNTHKQVVLVDWNRPIKYDTLLPIGSLRDLPYRVKHATAVVVTKTPKEGPHLPQNFKFKVPTFFTYLKYGDFIPVFPSADTSYIERSGVLNSPQIIVLTAIANPKPFLDFLSKKYEILEHLKFPDHHSFTTLELLRIRDLMVQCKTLALVTTEKDAVRLRPHQLRFEEKNNSCELLSRIFYVPIEHSFFSEEDKQSFLKLLS